VRYVTMFFLSIGSGV